MLRNILKLGKPLLSSVVRKPKPFLPNFYRRFTTVADEKAALCEHHNQMRRMQSISTKMEEPKNVTQVSLQEWEELGFLGQMGAYAKGLEIYEVKNLPDTPGKNTPSGSWVRFKYPLKSEPHLRDNFKRFYNDGIRVGRMLEIMDYLAGTVAYRYSKENPKEKKVTMATASVYDVAIFENQIRADQDLLFTGYVCHVGKTSVEIRIDISHSEKPEDLAGSAYFMFVARNATDYSKAFVLPELSYEGETDVKKCILRNEYGKRNKERKRLFSEKSVFKVPPSSEESVQLHALFKKTLDPAIGLNYVPIHKTEHEKLILMHVQDKNRHGRVFGGYVMREATELAWMTALLHGDGTFPIYVHIDDVAFVRPIPIGSITRFKSCVSYIEDNMIHVEVTADNLGENGKEERVFEVNVTFAVKAHPKPVLPSTYFDGMLYLEGKRRLNNFYLI